MREIFETSIKYTQTFNNLLILLGSQIVMNCCMSSCMHARSTYLITYSIPLTSLEYWISNCFPGHSSLTFLITLYNLGTFIQPREDNWVAT